MSTAIPLHRAAPPQTGRSLALALLICSAAIFSSAPAQTFSIGSNFTGSTFGLQSSFIPPDTMGAVGPAHVVELINGRFRVYDRDGLELQTKDLNQFWTDTGTASSSAFDPRILFDAPTSRWFAVSVDNRANANSSYLVAVSDGADPTGTWTGHRIDADAGNTTWADFPTIGINAQGVFLAGNHFTNSGNTLDSIEVISLPKADLMTGSIANMKQFPRFSTNARGSSLQPVIDIDGTGPSNLHPIFATKSILSGTMAMSAINYSNINNPTLTSGTQLLADGTFPPFADQPGPKVNLHTSDGRIGSNAVLVAGNVWAARAIDDGSGRSVVQVFRADPFTNSIIESVLISDPSLSYYYPSIAVNTLGDIVVGFSGSDANTFVSSFAAAGYFDGATTSFGVPQLLKPGVSDYQRLDSSGRNRWGDYSATMIDPANPQRFWTFQEFVSATDTWSIQVTEIVVPEPAALLLGSIGALLLIVAARHGARRTRA